MFRIHFESHLIWTGYTRHVVPVRSIGKIGNSGLRELLETVNQCLKIYESTKKHGNMHTDIKYWLSKKDIKSLHFELSVKVHPQTQVIIKTPVHFLWPGTVYQLGRDRFHGPYETFTLKCVFIKYEIMNCNAKCLFIYVYHLMSMKC